MKRFFNNVLVAIAGLALCSSVAYAQEFKIGVVNAPRLLEAAPQAESARTRLEAEFAPRDRELVAMQKELRELDEKLNKDRAVMSETESRKMERDILQRQREIKRAQDEFRDDLNLRRNEELGKVQRLVYDAIVSLAKEKKFDLIVSDGVIYASDRVDITDQVLERLKKDSDAAGGR